MRKDHLLVNIREFQLFADQAEHLLTNEERKALKDAEDQFLSIKQERGLLAFGDEEIGNIWEEALDSVPGARNAIYRKYDIAEGLMYVSRTKATVLQ